MRYCLEPLDLNTTCDGCGAKFTVQHALACKVGGLVTLRHNEVKEELMNLCQKAFTPSAVRDEPLINPTKSFSSHTDPNPQKQQQLQDNNERGDIIVQGIWNKSKYYIIDVRITDIN